MTAPKVSSNEAVGGPASSKPSGSKPSLSQPGVSGSEGPTSKPDLKRVPHCGKPNPLLMLGASENPRSMIGASGTSSGLRSQGGELYTHHEALVLGLHLTPPTRPFQRLCALSAECHLLREPPTQASLAEGMLRQGSCK